jgi:hypothetical protein
MKYGYKNIDTEYLQKYNDRVIRKNDYNVHLQFATIYKSTYGKILLGDTTIVRYNSRNANITKFPTDGLENTNEVCGYILFDSYRDIRDVYLVGGKVGSQGRNRATVPWKGSFIEPELGYLNNNGYVEIGCLSDIIDPESIHYFSNYGTMVNAINANLVSRLNRYKPVEKTKIKVKQQ